MRLAHLVLGACAAFGLSVSLSGQSGAPSPPVSLKTSEKQFVMGPIEVETSANGQARIQFWLNTATFLAKPIILEASKFTIMRAANGGQLIESVGAVRVTGFTLGQDINRNPMLQDPDTLHGESNQLIWERAFRLQILADGTPQWFCCPRVY